MRLLLTLIFICSILTALGQTTINGIITTGKDKPVGGASISLEGTYDGATADSLGRYTFTTSETGKHIILISAIGYKDFSDSINLSKGTMEKNFQLESLATEMDAVVITVGAFEASDRKKSTVLSSLDVVTTASANGDVTNALKTLPGAQQVGESEGLFVRGGTSEETKFFIDGTLVNNFFYTSEPGQSTRGRFNPFLFQGTLFSSGGYSALYGQALSSVVLLESIDLPDQTSAQLGITYLSANAGIQKLSRDKKSSWGASFSYANLALAFALNKQKMDYFTTPVEFMGDANFRFKTKSGGMVKYYGYYSHSKVGFRNTDIDSPSLKDAFALQNDNMYHNLSWKEKLGNRWKLQTAISFSTNLDQIDLELQNKDNQQIILEDKPLYANKNFSLENMGRYLNTRWTLEKGLGGLSAIRFGSEYNFNRENMVFTNYKGKEFPLTLRDNLFAGYAEADIYITNRLAAKPGIRLEHSSMFDLWNFAPRLSLAYRFRDRGQVSFAYGQYYQNPANKYLPALNQLHFQKATHYILQYQKMFKDRIFRIEAYYKDYDDLIKTIGNGGNLRAINNDGYGEAKGIEIFWRDKTSIKDVDYWFSYTFLDTRRDFLNYPKAIVPPFSAKHTASLVIKKFVLPLKTQFNASYTFASGRPYYDIQYDQDADKFFIASKGHTKSYHDLSLSINYLPSIVKKDAKSFSVWVLSLTNVLGSKNIYNYRFSADGQNKMAIRPPSRRFLFLGYFVSFGIDRTQDVINNNL